METIRKDKRGNRYSDEVRERAVRMVLEHQGEYSSPPAAMQGVASTSVDNLQMEILRGSVKDFFSFGRFYASGAIVMQVMERLDVPDRITRIEQKDSPMDVLTSVVPEACETSKRAAEVTQRLDPSGDILEEARIYAE